MANLEMLQSKLDKLNEREKLIIEQRKRLEHQIAAAKAKEVERLLKQFDCSVPELKTILSAQQPKEGGSDV